MSSGVFSLGTVDDSTSRSLGDGPFSKQLMPPLWQLDNQPGVTTVSGVTFDILLGPLAVGVTSALTGSSDHDLSVLP
jgi:hypothetical protein